MRSKDFSQRHFESIVDSSDDAIVSKTLDGRVISWNKGAERIFGYSADEMLGQRIFRLCPLDRVQEEEEILRKIGQGMRIDHIETVRLHKNGSIVHVSVTISPIMDEEGRVVGASKIARDISKRKLFEAELELHRHRLESLVQMRTEELNQALEKAQAAAKSKSIFLANMSHEIRTPLNAIIGMTHLLLEEVQDAGQKAQLVHIDTAAGHLLNVLNDILDLSKIESGKVVLEESEFNIASQCKSIYSMFEAAAKSKDISIRLDIDPRLERVNVVGDPLRVSQILINLVSNAIKFTPEGKKDPSIVHFKAVVANERSYLFDVQFDVEDQGIGIDQSLTSRIFDAFEQADSSITREFGGTGLGLAISIRLARLMKGDIKVFSTPGKGSRFSLAIPLKLAMEGQFFEVSPRSLDLRKGANILLVEDNALNLIVAKRLLEKKGLNVSTAANGEIAVKMAKSGCYDLILMDMQMPVMGGIEATQGHLEKPRLAQPW